MSQGTLTVLLGGQVLGHVEQNQRGKLRFGYDATWRAASNAIPLSLSMPLVAAEYGHETIGAFLSGLLPDNRKVLEAWGHRFDVSPRNPFALMSYIGEDCAGAVQFVREERLDEVLDDKTWAVEWLDDADVEARLGALRRDRTAWRAPRDTGQFSLAGAQPKTALLRQDGRWGIPAGRAPTTHILKPPLPDFDGHVENEHVCLQLARELSLPVATSRVMRFGNEVAIVIERYDRVSTAQLATAAAAEAAVAAADPDATRGARTAADAAARTTAFATLAKAQPVLRLHQEDLCQAMSLMPTAKSQSEGGPTPAQVVALLQAHSSRPVEDVACFLDALAFNWLIAGTDAHAKNYSLLHGGGGRVRLAPLYDLASALPYDELDFQRITLAMKVGSKYRVRDITGAQWRKLAATLQLDPDETIARVASMTENLADAVAAVRVRAEGDGLGHEIVGRLAQRISARAEECLARLDRP